MSKTYKNTSDRAILGIEPGQTGDLDDATGYVGPDALEEVEAKQTGDVPGYGNEIPVTKLPQPVKAPPAAQGNVLAAPTPQADGD